MYGWRDRGDEAQLALMDAMVFFAISIVICGMLTSFSLQSAATVEDEVELVIDPEGVLAAYLRASLGKEIELESARLVLVRTTSFGETLYVISSLAAQGVVIGELESVLTYCHEVLVTLCDPWSVRIQTYLADSGGETVLVELGEETPSDCFAASQNLGACEGSQLMVTLILAPTLLPEIDV